MGLRLHLVRPDDAREAVLLAEALAGHVICNSAAL